jgi:hypothetical protein
MTTTITRRTELAHRMSGGIDVYLFWNEPTNRVTVCVLDAQGDNGIEFEVEGSQALDAFNHPYVYAAQAANPGGLLGGPATTSRSSGNSKKTTINPWRTNHARTDQ